MGDSWGHKLRLLTPAERVRWADRGYYCVTRGCHDPATYASTYSYRTGQGGRVSTSTSKICDDHAAAFARRWKLPVPDPAPPLNQHTFVVAFERIGRHAVQPLTARPMGGEDASDRLARLIRSYAGQMLGELGLEVVVDLEAMSGRILCGGRDGGRFTLQEAGPE